MQTMWMIILWVLAAAAALYLLAVLWVFLFQGRLIYVPNRTLWCNPGDSGIPHEEVFLPTADGVSIHGWYISAHRNAGTVLFFHGNAGNIAYLIETAAMFHKWGLNTLLIDYHGYGNSGGKPSELTTRLDADAAWDFLVKRKGISPNQIIIFGRSLGAAVAADLAARIQPGGVILESGFSSLSDLGATIYPWLPVRFLSRNHYPTIKNVTRFRCPVLVAHSREDELISFDHAERIFTAAPEPKFFLEMVGNHRDCVSATGVPYEQAIQSFIFETLISPPSK